MKRKTQFRDYDVPTSQEFEDAFSSRVSGSLRTCFCGRTHFDVGNDWDWETGELEKLKLCAIGQPDQYFPQDYAISTTSVDGVDIVVGCKCNHASRYEQFIIKHAPEIADYLNKRAASLKAQADAMTISK